MVAPTAERLGISFDPSVIRSPQEAPFHPLKHNPFGEGLGLLQQRANKGDYTGATFMYRFAVTVAEIVEALDPHVDTMNVTLAQMYTNLHGGQIDRGSLGGFGLEGSTMLAAEEWIREMPSQQDIPWEVLSATRELLKRRSDAHLHDAIVVARSICEAQTSQAVNA